MKLGIIGKLFPLMFSKAVYGYTVKAVPELDMRAFQKKHRKEYEAMVKRTPSVGSMKDNMFAAVMYMACYGFSYYKADPEHITMEVFDGMIGLPLGGTIAVSILSRGRIQLQHGRLYREHTIANGESVCDYWGVRDKLRDPK